ncbi:unnamed protein product [Rotaria sp. Silwood2]|nr:unnamed protein product [Rotaria sp. Silwood2]CAF2518608.1 unnamed protein product [Rotaria sp. Silwood2]CAF2810942.1 unnamed protein product [Rotaria sp. Silwood2]CAF2915957.1 unnamed protein product [Rotaria sp. Silwood2]
MHRIFATLFSEEPLVFPKQDEDPIEHKNEDQIEALQDLHASYAQPIKCSHQTNSKKISDTKNSISILKQREIGLINFRRYPEARYRLMNRYLYYYCIRLYDTSSSRTFNRLAEIEVDDVGWSILDTAVSPDRSSVAYSTWSHNIYLVKLDENQCQPNIVPLYLQPRSNDFSIFSLQFSVDGSEIICGANDTCVYIFDLQKQKRTLRVLAHQNDVNTVGFIDNSNSLVVSGSDDGLVLIWDRRALNESQPKPVGIFAGHTSGITFVHSRMDSRYLISNCKDQTIKLWDMRRFANNSTIQKSRTVSNAINRVWDYRAGVQPQTLQRHDISGDPSVCTYRGHSIGYTLIRCYFSPSFTTGQRYIITGSADGCIYIYNVLTGAIERCLRIRNNQYGAGRDKCVRDVAWHPFENYIISTSWDNRRAHVRWTHKTEASTEPSLSPPIETKVASVQTPASPSPTNQSSNRLTTFQRLLIQPFFDLDYNMESDSDSDLVSE